MKKIDQPKGESPSRLIDAKIKELGDWRGETLSQIRALIKQADPEVVEEVKWIKPSNPLGVAVWSHDGLICTGEIYKNAVKMTSPMAPRWMILQVSSILVLKVARGVPSTSTKATRSTRRP